MHRVSRLTLLSACALALALPALADHHTTEGAEAHGHDMAAMEEAMKAAAAPGEHHAFLASMEGDWTYASKVWMDPSAPPMESSGESTKTMIMGGRYLQEEASGDFMGQSFRGRGVTGYDNTAGSFFNTWIDNMSTGMATSKGQRDGNTLTLEGDYLDPMSKQNMKVRAVTRIVDEDHHVFEYHMSMPGVDEFKSMELTYTRKGSE